MDTLIFSEAGPTVSFSEDAVHIKDAGDSVQVTPLHLIEIVSLWLEVARSPDRGWDLADERGRKIVAEHPLQQLNLNLQLYRAEQ